MLKYMLQYFERRKNNREMLAAAKKYVEENPITEPQINYDYDIPSVVEFMKRRNNFHLSLPIDDKNEVYTESMFIYGKGDNLIKFIMLVSHIAFNYDVLISFDQVELKIDGIRKIELTYQTHNENNLNNFGNKLEALADSHWMLNKNYLE